jgi:intracellular sulfur oxidation DsrE/DsrF family protein
MENSMLFIIRWLVVALVFTTANNAMAGADKFTAGPVIKNYGKHAYVQQDLAFNKSAKFKVAFDISEQGKAGAINRKIETLARFINMHVANGIAAENIELALVVHGKAGFDLIKEKLYQEKFQQNNVNAELLTQLMKNRVEVYLCGQSAAYYDISNEMLQPGIKMALSAMTAHAVLQSEGYSLNPF